MLHLQTVLGLLPLYARQLSPLPFQAYLLKQRLLLILRLGAKMGEALLESSDGDFELDHLLVVL